MHDRGFITPCLLPVFITGVLLLGVITGGTTAAPTQHPPLGYVLLVY